jgi:hypothetical protein
MRKASKKNRLVVAMLATMGLWVAITAESCSTSLKKANQGLTAIDQTCNDLIGNDQATSGFAAAEADQANVTSQSLSQTKSDATASLSKHCSANQNSDYKPYTDVQMDLMGIHTP